MTHSTHTQQALFAPFVDEQALAQAELETYIEAQAQAVAPEELKVVEINFYEHEIYALDKLVAKITYDNDDFQTQRWIVMVNSVEVHRANTWLKCHNYITWHFSHGKLPVQEQENGTAATVYEVMAEIVAACEEFGFDVTNDGEIYHNSVKLGWVGCTDGRWWVAQASSEHQIKVPCDSAFDGVWLLSMVEASANKYADQKPACFEELLDKPFEMLTPQEWATLKEYSPQREQRRVSSSVRRG